MLLSVSVLPPEAATLLALGTGTRCCEHSQAPRAALTGLGQPKGHVPPLL